jgi:ribosomal-protein-alanine N-acetyltransferase
LFEISRFESTADTAPLAALHAASFSDPWDAPSLRTMLTAPGAFAFHHPDGFVVARTAAGEAEILTLAVAPPARGKGLGRALLTAAIAEAKKMGAEAMFLEVASDNVAALALYAGLGFAKVGMRKGYYRGRDAALLRLPLSGELA